MEFRGVDPTKTVIDHARAIEQVITDLPPVSGLELLAFVRGRMDAIEARLVAGRYEAGASDRGVEDLLGTGGKTSKVDAKKRALRGKAAHANPELATRLAMGDLSTEQVDIIATAAEVTDGAAACDATLIDEVAATTPEQGKKKATTFVNKHVEPADVQRRHDRQRRRRGWYRHRTHNGNSALTFHGDDEAIDDMERAVKAQAELEYRKDGGRSTADDAHARTRDQRCFDAAHALVAGSNSKTSKGGPGARSGSANAPNRRFVTFVKTTLDQLVGIDPSVVTTADGKPLPQSIVDEFVRHGEFVGQIYSQDGALLWQGRSVRLATPDQVFGLIARDGGCVRCGRHYDDCVAHHLLPFEAPAKGETNIDQLAFLCDDCHQRLHQNKQTLFRDEATQTWRIRPATWDEIPHDGRPKPPTTPGTYTPSVNRRPRGSPPEFPSKSATPTPRTQPRLDEQIANRRLF